ncbi:ABC transporter ATP-binding protein [Pradoshia sp. D12]|uniref:ABC transporter ATP-binding protein n=1 Tax=Bacillaceae TaxID=186817 RepID=UPI00112E31B0|nr:MULTISPECIES: ABC transporter ATP-binding protein [Bacillaceae]QFK71172.1 ABC transporter ATP-binding protein [Pradoshia sp. D12]TPF72965.1 ABC transporter ATP-binding protein [Bacillus sp. D12]
MNSFLALIKYLKSYKLIVLLGPLCMIVEVTMDLIQPTIMQNIIDKGIASSDSRYVVTMSIFMLFSAIIGLLGGMGSTIFSTRSAIHFSTDLRRDVFEKIDYFSGENTDKFGAGKLITIMTNDISAVQQAVMMTLRIFVRGPIMFIGSIIIVFFTARELFPILLAVVPVLTILIVLFTWKAGHLFQMVQKAIDRVNTKLQENLAGIRVIKAFGTQNHEMKQFQIVNKELTAVNIRADQVIMGLMPILLFIVNMGIVAAIWMGAIKVDNGSLNVGVIVAFINYLTIILNSLMTSSNVLMQITRAFPSAGRIVDVLNTEQDIKQSDQPLVPVPDKGTLEFKNVSFSYSKNGERVLSNVSFSVPSGQTLGIIGATGSGKTTLVKLLPRLYDVDEGQILLNGIDIKDMDIQELRKSVGFVPQKALLFSGTISQNLTQGNENATKDDMTEALQNAEALQFVEQLDPDYAYELTQGATNLSGGQRQRISIARAFIRKPSVIILDDSTSAVDAISESRIRKVLINKYPDSTKIIISSKLSSLKHADQILVLEDGKVTGIGSHSDLYQKNELYRELCSIQSEQGVSHL